MSLRHSARRVGGSGARSGVRRRRHAALTEALEPRCLLTTWYVDAASAGPTRNGSSWSAAYTDLQFALASAVSGDTIKVAQGTYKPTATTDRTVFFQPPSGVAIYGGYSGATSSTPDVRDPDLYPTTLSGNIGSATSAADNSYHVLYLYYPTATITLDGLNITAGNANGSSSPNNSGGGVYYTAGGGGGLIIRQCTFLANAASSGGGGAAFISDAALITNCAFRANTTTTYGGALYLRSTFNTVNNSTFVGNSASSAGGAIYAGSSPTVTNCTLAANAAPSGSGLYVGGSGYSPKITNSILWGNTSGSQIGIFLGSAVVTYSDVQAGFAGTGNINADPAFTRAPFKGADGKWGTADDDYGDLRLQATSPCLDVGSSAAAPSSTTTDLAGRPRLTDVPSVPNGAAGWVDMGAYEYPVVPAVLWFAQPAGQAFENAGSFTVTVRLSSFTDLPAAVPIYVTGGTADASDYSGIPASLVIPAGQSSASFAVNITDDRLVEQPETLLLSLGTPDNALLGTPATFTLALLDNDLLYVDAAATGGAGDGSSWANAFTDLQAALAKATAGSTLHVAAGTYKPAPSGPSVSFVLKTGVALYGGYAGAADPGAPRDVARYRTTLSGDVGAAGTATDNSAHVVVGSGTDATAVLDGFTIAAGYAGGSVADTGYGGGLYNRSGSPTIANCTFVGNHARSNGAAIYNENRSSPSIVNCTFSGNDADGDGGAIYTDYFSAASVTGCTFTKNSASFGGAIYWGTGTAGAGITNCTFTANAADTGGAIYYNGASVTPLTNCAFVANVAYSSGGALSGSLPNIDNCTFAFNTSVYGNGGALYHSAYASPSITNSILWGNFAQVGNQIYTSATAGALLVTFCDVQGGQAGTGNINADPLFFHNPSAGPDGQWGTADDDFGDLRLSPASPCVDAGNNTAVPPAATTADLAGGPRLVDVPTTPDTGPGPLVDLGAYEATPALAAAAGGPYAVLEGQPLTLAGRGASDEPGPLQYAWEWTGDGLFDDAAGSTPAFPVGAFAPGGTATVALRVTDAAGRSTTSTSLVRIAPAVAYVDYRATGSGTGVDWASAYTTLATALALAVPGQTICVAGGTYRPTVGTDRTAAFRLQTGVALYGGYAGNADPTTPDVRDAAAHPTILSGDIGAPGSNADNSYHVLVASGTDPSAILDGFTVTAGNATGRTPFGDGGGLYVRSGSPIIRNCAFVANSATRGGGIFILDASAPTITGCTFSANVVTGSGAGIFNGASSAAVIAGCTFTANSADTGAGMYNSSASPTITGCTFVANSSGTSYGGGAAIYNAASSPLIANCVFNANSVYYFGGSVLNSSSSPTFVNCTFTANSANAAGGAVYNSFSAPTFVNCDFVANSVNYPNASGGAMYDYSSSPIITNCILWANSAATGAQLYNSSSASTPLVTYSDVQGGYAGTGNLNADPRFYRTPGKGADGKWATPDDDYGDLRLLPDSPVLDAGSNAAVPASVATDLAGHARTIDFPGAGPANTAVVDMGAFEASTDLGTLHLTSGQTVALPAGGYGFTATQLTLDPGAILDLANDSLLIDYAGTSPLPSIRSALASGYASGTWTGAGITSSTARATSNHAVGYAEAAALGLHTFNGQPTDATALFLRYTSAGDANLDGKLNADDFALSDRGRAKGSDNWVFGDFDYDGIVTAADLTLLNRSFAAAQQALAPDAAALETADVPAAPDIQDLPSAPASATRPATSTSVGVASNAMPKTAAVQLCGPARVQRGKVIAFTLKGTSAQSKPSTPVRYAIDWNGDGRVDQIVAGRSAINVKHKFGSAGLFNVTVSILDGKGHALGLRKHLSVRVAK